MNFEKLLWAGCSEAAAASAVVVCIRRWIGCRNCVRSVWLARRKRRPRREDMAEEADYGEGGEGVEILSAR